VNPQYLEALILQLAALCSTRFSFLIQPYTVAKGPSASHHTQSPSKVIKEIFKGTELTSSSFFLLSLINYSFCLICSF
jgi:hypothetical protein